MEGGLFSEDMRCYKVLIYCWASLKTQVPNIKIQTMIKSQMFNAQKK